MGYLYTKGVLPMPNSNRLSDASCRSAKPKAKPYKLSDGEGLYLLVKPNGSRLWQKKYSYAGKSKTLSFGAYPTVSLQEAREKRLKAKQQLANGRDPGEVAKEAKREVVRNATNTFHAIALEWYDTNKSRWSEQYAATMLQRLERYLVPHIGKKPLSNISASDVLDTLRRIESHGHYDAAKRARQICAQVFDYGIQLGRCTANPAAPLKSAIKSKKIKHFPSLPVDEMPIFLSALERNEARLFPQTRNALALLMHTFVRPGEMRFARWEHIDLENATWTIPAEYMKMRRDHVVPLSTQALALLKTQKEQTDLLNSPWVFPGQNSPKRPISECTLVNAIKRMGFVGKHTAHGFRALARTAIREKLDYPPDIIEKQLAHEPSGSLGAAYDRTQFLSQRRKMMQEWSDYIESKAPNKSEATKHVEVVRG